MKKSIILIIILSILGFTDCYSQNSTRKERNFIVKGNELYKDSLYSEAIGAYNNALRENPSSSCALFNKALSEMQIAFGISDESKKEYKDSLLNSSVQSMNQISTRYKETPELAAKANYAMGNVAFNSQDYKGAIDMYKQALRINPNYENARKNLRIAQKKLAENQQNQGGGDNNQEKQKEENKQEDNKQENKQNNQPQQQNKDNQQQQPQQQNDIKETAADQILKRGEAKEKELRARVLGSGMGNEAEQNNRGGRSRKNW